jgi:tRNA pseudouridine55 synthase
MEVLKVEIPRVTFRIVCSAGTYIRVLCQSLGEALGVGGCMEALERTRVGPFLLKDALKLEEVKIKVEEGRLSDMLLPGSLLVEHLPKVKLAGKALAELCQGKLTEGLQMPEGLAGGGPSAAQGPRGLCRILNEQGFLSAIAETQADGKLKPKKVFGVEGIP